MTTKIWVMLKPALLFLAGWAFTMTWVLVMCGTAKAEYWFQIMPALKSDYMAFRVLVLGSVGAAAVAMGIALVSGKHLKPARFQRQQESDKAD